LPIVAWRVELRPDIAPTPITPDDMVHRAARRQTAGTL
jgi:hypothetical protein